MGGEKVTIDKIGGGGVGLARAATGQILMVPDVLPGEEVRVRIRRRHRDYLEGELVEVLQAHPGRVPPPCPHFGPCGGCDLQQAEYRLQVALKQEILQEHLRRRGVLTEDVPPEVMVVPLAAPHPFGYRQRLRLQVNAAGRWGFFRRRSHQLEEIDVCPLARPEIVAALHRFPASSALMQLLRNSLEVELISSPGNGALILLLNLRRKPRPADRQAAGRVGRDLPEVTAVYLEAEGVGRTGPFAPAGPGAKGENGETVRLEFPARPEFRLPPYALIHEVGGFSQVNLEQNRGMIATMLEWLANRKIERAADLFCGQGNFSLPLALAGIRLFGADLQRSAIRSAKTNAVAAGLTDCSFIQASAEEATRQLVAGGERYDLVVLDPPRRGCPEVIPMLAELAAPYLLYISCDPATLARDLATLLAQGYRLEKMRMIDMFPQTAHLETMALLVRRPDAGDMK